MRSHVTSTAHTIQWWWRWWSWWNEISILHRSLSVINRLGQVNSWNEEQDLRIAFGIRIECGWKSLQTNIRPHSQPAMGNVSTNEIFKFSINIRKSILRWTETSDVRYFSVSIGDWPRLSPRDWLTTVGRLPDWPRPAWRRPIIRP